MGIEMSVQKKEIALLPVIQNGQLTTHTGLQVKN
jgi:hypothetical protein